MTGTREFSREDVCREAFEAEKRIKGYAGETPLEYDPFLSRLGNGNVF